MLSGIDKGRRVNRDNWEKIRKRETILETQETLLKKESILTGKNHKFSSLDYLTDHIKGRYEHSSLVSTYSSKLQQ